MSLKSTTNYPPGGFIYVQKETGQRFREMHPFLDQVKVIVEHRRANQLPRATMAEAAEDLDAYTCQRIGNDPQWCEDGQKKTSLPSSSPPLVKVAEALTAAVKGASILTDWLGEGGVPVADPLAQARADICVGLCSDPVTGFNKPGNMFARFITGPIAAAILEQRREKTNLALTVKNEDKLHTCSICLCDLTLKVHVPMSVIMKRTAPELLEKFPNYCFMVTENRRENSTLSRTAEKTTDEPIISRTAVS